MKHRFPIIVVVILLVAVVCSILVEAQDVNAEKGRAKNILKIVAKDIEKNFYDPQIRGLDWASLTEQTRERIDRAQSIGQIYTAIFSMVDKIGDSHTAFLPPGRAARPLFGFEAKAYGDDVMIYKLKKGGAAEAAGLQLGDRILKVNNFDAERNTFDKMMLYYRVLQPAQRLNVMIQRGNEQIPVPLNAKVKRESVILDLRDDLNLWDLIREMEGEGETSYYREPDADGIAYMGLTSFVHSPDWMIGFAEKVGKPKAAIVDLRGNFGGSIDAVIAFASHFVRESEPIADIVTRKKTETVKTKPHRSSIAVPLVVLVDSQSSSGSEMFARFFQRAKKARIIGDHTMGRLTASNFFSESLGTDRIVPFGVQIATGTVVFPGNEEVERIGITPDQLCLPTAQDLHEERDPCYALARSTLRESHGLKDDPRLRDEKGRKSDLAVKN